MNTSLKECILKATGAADAVEIAKIQDLWSGYGTLKRFRLEGADRTTVIVKHICPPGEQSHPRGWNTSVSHQRKLKSYQVEVAWYRSWSKMCKASCRVPQVYALESHGSEICIVMEDLDSAGFPLRLSAVTGPQMRSCIKWLAHFHATFLGKQPEGLWETGTYWHLETRPEELQALSDRALKSAAATIDKRLRECRFKTFVHGDAKLANFCFSKDGKKVAAVDFQYVGGGCGMKDLAYFVGSCLHEEDCDEQESAILDYYFEILQNIVRSRNTEIDPAALREEWRALYSFAWADFHRFIKGWSPGHWKIHSYSERTTRKVLDSL